MASKKKPPPTSVGPRKIFEVQHCKGVFWDVFCFVKKRDPYIPLAHFFQKSRFLKKVIFLPPFKLFFFKIFQILKKNCGISSKFRNFPICRVFFSIFSSKKSKLPPVKDLAKFLAKFGQIWLGGQICKKLKIFCKFLFIGLRSAKIGKIFKK